VKRGKSFRRGRERRRENRVMLFPENTEKKREEGRRDGERKPRKSKGSCA
jgi:hypothetical protein